MSDSSYLVNKEQIPFGTIINNRYLIQKILGQGGLGRTYLALDTHRFNEACVLKEFAPLGSGKYELEKSRDLFKREAKILHQITHPQIPKFLACFEGHGRLFLVQEFVNGKTYSALLQERQHNQIAFSEMEIVKWLLNLLPILEYIHELGIIHRDISPDNIMQPAGKELPVLIDFGVGKLTNATPLEYGQAVNHSYVGKMSFVGKIGYAPREQISMGRCSPSSDIYALGVTALVMLTGKEPTALLDQYSLEWQWHKFIDVSTQLSMILERMTAERPLERYQSAQLALEHIQDSYPVSQYPSLIKTVPYQYKMAKPAVVDDDDDDDDDTEIVSPSAVRVSSSVEKQVNPQPRSPKLSNPNISSVGEVDDGQETMQETMIVSDDSLARSSQESQNQPPPQNTTPPISSSINRIDPIFVKRCEQELAYCIGPMASLIVEEILAQQPASNHELMEALAQQIPDVKKATEFRQRLLSN